MSAICTKTKNGVIPYNNYVLQMPNDWLQMGVKQTARVVLRPGTLSLGSPPC